jgi:hypothetical protein
MAPITHSWGSLNVEVWKMEVVSGGVVTVDDGPVRTIALYTLRVTEIR